MCRDMQINSEMHGGENLMKLASEDIFTSSGEIIEMEINKFKRMFDHSIEFDGLL